MFDTQAIKAQDIDGLSRAELNALIPQLLTHVQEQTLHIGEQRKRLDSAAQAIKWRDAKIEKITFELARLKDWRFGAKSERMSAEQRELFAETLAVDMADLEARLAALQAAAQPSTPVPEQSAAKRKPKREPLPEHLPRVDTRVEPENTTCECGEAMQRVGEDVSERQDNNSGAVLRAAPDPRKVGLQVLPAHAPGTRRPQVFDNALPTPALQAHVVVSRFVDHLPYYRQETIHARSG